MTCGCEVCRRLAVEGTSASVKQVPVCELSQAGLLARLDQIRAVAHGIAERSAMASLDLPCVVASAASRRGVGEFHLALGKVFDDVRKLLNDLGKLAQVLADRIQVRHRPPLAELRGRLPRSER